MPTTTNRPFGVTVLSILAWCAGALAVIHVLQSLALMPFFIGSFAVIGFSLWSAIMWALIAWVWFWLTQMLRRVDSQAWQFLTFMTAFNLVLDFIYLVGRAEWTDLSINFLINAAILFYCMLPNVRKSFGLS